MTAAIDWLHELVAPQLAALGFVVTDASAADDLCAVRLGAFGEHEVRFAVVAGSLTVSARVIRQDPLSPATDWRPVRLDLMGVARERLNWTTRAEADRVLAVGTGG